MDTSQGTTTVTIFKNSKPGQGIKVTIRTSQKTFKNFLDVCSEVLNIGAKRVYDSNGEDLQYLSQLQQDNNYYISSGEKFNPQGSELHSTQNGDKQFQKSFLVDSCQTYLLVVMGAAAVGKSNVTLRYVKNQTFEHYDPTLQDEYPKKTTINNKYCLIKITDTSGQETYESLRTQWMKDKEGIVFLYSIDSRESFNDLYNSLELFQAMDKNPDKPVTIAVVGNKCDLEQDRQVLQDEGQKLAQKYNALFFETSAKTSLNVQLMFETIIQHIMKSRDYIKQQNQQKLAQKRREDKNLDKSWFKQYCSLI